MHNFLNVHKIFYSLIQMYSYQPSIFLFKAISIQIFKTTAQISTTSAKCYIFKMLLLKKKYFQPQAFQISHQIDS